MIKIKEEVLGEGDWIKLLRSTFLDPQGKSFFWEHIDRKNNKHAVLILATFEPSGDVLLIKQFRPGVNDFVLALPAGIVEHSLDEVHKDAVRELQEETGYLGEVTEISPVLSSFPALSDASVQLVQMTIDENLSINQNPQQDLELGEIIETLRVPRRNINCFLLLEAQQGTIIVSGLWYLFAFIPLN